VARSRRDPITGGAQGLAHAPRGELQTNRLVALVLKARTPQFGNRELELAMGEARSRLREPPEEGLDLCARL
jgi:hypothetical protein